MRYFLLILCFLIPSSTSAALVEVTTISSSVGVGETFTADVSLYTEGEMVNAVEGAVIVPVSMDVVEIRFSRSIVPYWIETPSESSPGQISFAGLLPGGYLNAGTDEVSKGNLFSLVLRAREEGVATLSVSPATSAYLNDGEGTSLSVQEGNATVEISEDVSGTGTTVTSDSESPEAFDIQMSEGTLFGTEGKMLVFVGIDKDSGIARYEIARSLIWIPEFMRSYVSVTSPAPLSPFDTYGLVWVRAVDTYENSTNAHFSPSGIFGYVPTIVLTILMCVLIAYLLIRKKAIITS